LWPLPTIEEANPFAIGVFYSRRAEDHRGDRPRPPYIPRVLDEELAELLRSQPLILVRGQSRAGKSRTAFEIATRELAGWQLLVPKHRRALTALAELDPLPGQGERVLVWLDDLDKYLAVEGAYGLDAGMLDRWARSNPPIKVLATIRLEEYGRLAATVGELGRAVREVLNRFDAGAITLPVTFDDPSERVAISELYPHEQLSGGLAEHLAAAHELVDRLEVGQASAPEGAGLVLAAVDCHRAGLNRPVAKADLAALLPLYLRRLRPLTPFGEGDVDRGLRWATEPVGRTAALLVADPDSLAGTFRVADPVVDFVERRDGRKLTQLAVWEQLIARVSVREAMEVAFAAYTRGEPGAATTAWQRVIDSGHPDVAPMAAFGLGVLLKEQGDLAGARAAWQRGIDSGHPDAAPRAAVNLGILLREWGDAAGARAAWQQAIDSDHPEATPMAAFGLGVLLFEQDDLAGAHTAWQQAIDSDHPDAAPRAALGLGMLFTKQGDLDGGRTAWQRTIDSDHPEVAPMAALGLGMLLAEQDNLDGAHTAWQQAIDSDHPEAAPMATFYLGLLLEYQGDSAGAKAAFEKAIDSEYPEAAAAAQQALRNLNELGHP
jgi:tetratricopeptide (TPR) repeat protein